MTEPTTPQGAGAQRTYDRRRARSAAETLAQIPPNRWDDTTKRILLTLATMLTPSAIDPLLEAGALAVHVDVDQYERARQRLNDTVELAQPAWSPRWRDLPDGTEDIREAFAAELDRMGLLPSAEEADDERERDEAAAEQDAAELDERETVANGVVYGDAYDRAAVAEANERNARSCHDPECTGLHVGPWAHVRGDAR